jgi:arginase
MQTKMLEVIGAQCGWGAGSHEAEYGPQVFKESGLLQALEADNLTLHWQSLETPTSYKNQKELPYQKRLKEITTFDTQLAAQVKAAIETSHFPVVLGGDHAIAMGTWSGAVSALKAAGQFGLIWIDAHMDSHTPQTSPSQNIHGMPLAALLGFGESVLVNLGESGTKLNPQHVVLIGVRSFEEGEAALLEKLKVKVFFIEEVKKLGFETVFKQAIAIATKDTLGFGLSIDLDAFDPSDAPGTGTPVADGLRAKEVLPVLAAYGQHPSLKAIEITEFNPTKDVNGKTATLAKDILLQLLVGKQK